MKKIKCPLCKKEINENIIHRHFRSKCKFANAISVYEYTCLIYGKEYVDDLIKKYQNGVSLNDIKRSTVRNTLSNISERTWLIIFNELNIHIRSIKEATNNDICRNKYKNTCENKYGKGITNVSQAQQVKDKKAETFIIHYGVDNIRKYKPFYEYVNKVCLERYGKKRVSIWENLTTDEHDSIVKKRFETLQLHGQFSSSLEERIAKIMTDNNIPFISQFFMYHHPYDFLFGDHKFCLLEIQGDYWHANPKIYKATDTFKNGKTAQDIWDHDKKFKDCLKNTKWKLYYLWEHDIMNMSDDDILKFLLDKIK